MSIWRSFGSSIPFLSMSPRTASPPPPPPDGFCTVRILSYGLQALVAKYGTDWVAVAEGFGGRFDRHQVRDRWYGVMTASGPRRVGKWSADEDAQLVKAVDELGQKWTAVARHVAGRTARQCRERYVNLLQPGLKFGPFLGGAPARSAQGGPDLTGLHMLSNGSVCGLPYCPCGMHPDVDCYQPVRMQRGPALFPASLKPTPNLSKEEQKVLAEACRELQAAYGRITWARVAERLPGRTDDQCSRAYEGLVKHDKGWSVIRVGRPAPQRPSQDLLSQSPPPPSPPLHGGGGTATAARMTMNPDYGTKQWQIPGAAAFAVYILAFPAL
ncbi:transcription factor Myb16 [Volvox carteri f. nagariensis]|uniref:Transcription factor Myb16 n=1 Tax=Volvox carteri f. nagariensis TaxID=3068 RepID=D8TYI8_VOLCA|nr:transcription factor Myb16 [Volvox carteri f. nagariensis]EFJ47650.1 transcription factor Myb16 [Volvox carteri f. nagariensis]|eukprot:XP_002951474.1 transcription factor Myb16 [Volvox carteri f. nagariensis]